MHKSKYSINTETLRTWLENKEPVFVLDVRPPAQREEWQIPGSHYLDAYKRLNEGDKTVLDEIEIPENVKVVTVCAAGRTSQIASDILKEKGIDASSLEGGMKSWSLAWNLAHQHFDDFEVWQIRRTGKGCLSYFIAANKEAIIVDASLSVEVYAQLVTNHHLSVKYVVETHIHADHLSRSKQLADYLNAPLLLPVPNKVLFPYHRIEDGQIIDLGKISIKVVATPGHTIESVCFLVNDEVLLTGDTLFTNAVGRPDLKANEEEAKKRAELLYDSLKMITRLNENIVVLPAHTNTSVDFDHKPIAATIGEIKRSVQILKLSKSDFVKTILDKLPPAPPNYLAIVERNLSGNISDVNPVDLEAGANRCAVS